MCSLSLFWKRMMDLWIVVTIKTWNAHSFSCKQKELLMDLTIPSTQFKNNKNINNYKNHTIKPIAKVFLHGSTALSIDSTPLPGSHNGWQNHIFRLLQKASRIGANLISQGIIHISPDYVGRVGDYDNSGPGNSSLHWERHVFTGLERNNDAPSPQKATLWSNNSGELSYFSFLGKAVGTHTFTTTNLYYSNVLHAAFKDHSEIAMNTKHNKPHSGKSKSS